MRYFRNRTTQEEVYECICDYLILEGGKKGIYIYDFGFGDYFQEVFPTLTTPIIPMHFDGDENEYLKKQRQFIKDNLRFECKTSGTVVQVGENGLIKLDNHTIHCNNFKFLDYFTPHIITVSEPPIKDKGKKETKGKLSYELYPEFITMMAERMEQSDKYPPYNWKKPIDKDEIIKAIVRHTMDIWKGKFDDDGRELGGIEALATNAMILAYQLKEVSDE